ncbi:ThuA domain-containing protein [Oceanobacillus caeni]|uniref:PalA n=1 Tax=Oceanobacillus caeni TaxID=405946 RepID=A0ABR5ML23_9BACI|nr:MULTISPECIES: ThuA domain-containing protein [Bacillaceae]KKE79706.1 PalA [Bacilli bacterium VT-13-104]PZD89579.1 trehalose utilization protein ThuA [Bacilli bacterium]KPH76664.1 PalA [Oceanobacillus caeni]MBU8789184.1 ThuA domain-containing protein [Oceanobacillus caeni]MCR1833333.1 ThuA domain-containing protein [Oceanobacillus caeni]
MNVVVWNEYRHEKENPAVKEVYPEGIHETLATFLREDGMNVKTVTLDEPEHGLTDELLQETDVLVWWGHKAHEEVKDDIAEKVKQRVLDGMGLVVLHSGHFSKVFKKLMGTGCDLKWREADERERLWVVDPTHPITEGIGEYIELEKEEMYGEHFDIPTPDELIFISWFEGGEVFRSGATFKRGRGKIFYFRPGHETYPTYHNEDIKQVIKNGVRWAKNKNTPTHVYGNHKPIENLDK